eukprot:4814416-Prorocentrum_lima.AAC.1
MAPSSSGNHHHATAYVHPQTETRVTLLHPHAEHSSLEQMLGQTGEGPEPWLLPAPLQERMEL